MLTIIIPVYNAHKTITETLSSLFKQTNKNFSVIIIDDGSKDQSVSVIKKLIENKANYRLITQKNKGVSYTRNKGIQLATTEYISFLDSDDMYLNHYVENFYKSVKNNQPDVIAFRNPRNKNKVISNLDYINYLKHKNTPDTNCWIIKKNLIINNKIKFDENFSWGEDMLFFYQVLFKAKHIIFINKICTKTNDTINSLSKIQYKEIESKLKWLKEVKRISNSRKIDKIVDGYLMRGTLLAALKNQEISKKEAKEHLKLFDFSNGFRSIKQSILVILNLLK